MNSQLLRTVRDRLVRTSTALSPHSVVTAIEATGQAPLTGSALLDLADRLSDELAGAGPLQSLLDDPRVTDVLVNGTAAVWADTGTGLAPTSITFPDEASIRALATRLAAACGRRLDDANPCADARLPDGTRLHAVLPPVAVSGPYLSLRTHRPRSFDMTVLRRAGTLDAQSAQWITGIIGARLPFIVTGGTGCGKTTLLGSLLALVDPGERIVIVEDSHELTPAHPHVLSLQARQANVEGAGSVGLRELVRQALRMRPDRIVVGECRGGEIIDLLTALNTGHDGSAGTLHANTATDVPARLAALALPHGLSRQGLHALIAAALRVVIHMRRDGGSRVVSEISMLEVSSDASQMRVSPVWRKDGGPTPAQQRLHALLEERSRPRTEVTALCAPQDH